MNRLLTLVVVAALAAVAVISPAAASPLAPTFDAAALEAAPVPCGPAAHAPGVVPPPPLRVAAPAEAGAPVCPEGQIPQPPARFAPKGRPGHPAAEADAPSALTYLYAYAYQYRTAIGAAGRFSQHRPFVSTADYHSLAELAAESSDARQIVEVGWTVDRGVNGDSNPHLFVYHWVNGSPTCYNGCGWVQYSAIRYPGMTVSVTSTPQEYAIEYYAGNWWVWYQTEWIGYFPGSLWSGFTQVGLVQWFGEVAANSSAPCTDMGNGLFGTSTGAA